MSEAGGGFLGRLAAQALGNAAARSAVPVQPVMPPFYASPAPAELPAETGVGLASGMAPDPMTEAPSLPAQPEGLSVTALPQRASVLRDAAGPARSPQGEAIAAPPRPEAPATIQNAEGRGSATAIMPEAPVAIAGMPDMAVPRGAMPKSEVPATPDLAATPSAMPHQGMTVAAISPDAVVPQSGLSIPDDAPRGETAVPAAPPLSVDKVPSPPLVAATSKPLAPAALRPGMPVSPAASPPAVLPAHNAGDADIPATAASAHRNAAAAQPAPPDDAPDDASAPAASPQRPVQVPAPAMEPVMGPVTLRPRRSAPALSPVTDPPPAAPADTAQENAEPPAGLGRAVAEASPVTASPVSAPSTPVTAPVSALRPQTLAMPSLAGRRRGAAATTVAADHDTGPAAKPVSAPQTPAPQMPAMQTAGMQENVRVTPFGEEPRPPSAVPAAVPRQGSVPHASQVSQQPSADGGPTAGSQDGATRGTAGVQPNPSVSAGAARRASDTPARQMARAFGAAAPGEADLAEPRQPTLMPEAGAPTFRPQPEGRLPSGSAAMPPVAPPPVRIEIGRLELASPPSAAPLAKPQYMSLSDYLRLRVRS